MLTIDRSAREVIFKTNDDGTVLMLVTVEVGDEMVVEQIPLDTVPLTELLRSLELAAEQLRCFLSPRAA
jgi:hypothetical protein